MIARRFVGRTFFRLGGRIFGADVDDLAVLRVHEHFGDVLAAGLHDVEGPDESVMFVLNFRALDPSVGNFFQRDPLRLRFGDFRLRQQFCFARSGEPGSGQNKRRQREGKNQMVIFRHAVLDDPSCDLFRFFINSSQRSNATPPCSPLHLVPGKAEFPSKNDLRRRRIDYDCEFQHMPSAAIS